MITAKVVADSVSDAGARVTTMEVVMPRIILSEFNTHRAFSRNSASSRAVPFTKMKERATFTPLNWGANQAGMNAKQEQVDDIYACSMAWETARRAAIEQAEVLHNQGLHKNLCNRLLEPFLWHTVIVTSTEWNNFFQQRCHPDAEYHMRMVANAMHAALRRSEPTKREWHTPYIEGVMPPREREEKISAARCARVSYLTHDGRLDEEEDLKLAEKLLTGNHRSPFEHVCRACVANDIRSGNFYGWYQMRKLVFAEPN